MDRYELIKGENRTRVNLSMFNMGNDLVVCIYNENAHIGAVALGEYDYKEERTSVSVITALGHKDDIIAREAAYSISKHTRKRVCSVVGIHIKDITEREIKDVVKNANEAIEEARLLLGVNSSLKT